MASNSHHTPKQKVTATDRRQDDAVYVKQASPQEVQVAHRITAVLLSMASQKASSRNNPRTDA